MEYQDYCRALIQRMGTGSLSWSDIQAIGWETHVDAVRAQGFLMQAVKDELVEGSATDFQALLDQNKLTVATLEGYLQHENLVPPFRNEAYLRALQDRLITSPAMNWQEIQAFSGAQNPPVPKERVLRALLEGAATHKLNLGAGYQGIGAPYMAPALEADLAEGLLVRPPLAQRVARDASPEWQR